MLNMAVHCTEHNVDSCVRKSLVSSLLPVPQNHWQLCSLCVSVCNNLDIHSSFWFQSW